jgi:hypothetical protein
MAAAHLPRPGEVVAPTMWCVLVRSSKEAQEVPLCLPSCRQPSLGELRHEAMAALRGNNNGANANASYRWSMLL